jgi:phosphatidylglycerophosphate synthase
MVAAILLLSAVAVRADFSERLPLIVGDVLHWGGLGFFVIATLLTVSSGLQYMVKYWSIFTGRNEGKQ